LKVHLNKKQEFLVTADALGNLKKQLIVKRKLITITKKLSWCILW